MDSTIKLQQSLIKEVATLFGDETAMKKLMSFTKKLKREAKQKACDDDNVMTEKDKQEILEEIRQGLIEVKMAKEGKIKLQTWEDFKHELHH